jgi:hypothetical protein
MVAEWRDRGVVLRKSGNDIESETVEQNFGFDGGIGQVPLEGGSAGKPGEKSDASAKTDPKVRLTTDIRIHDDSDTVMVRHGQQTARRTRDRFAGSASYNHGVPREARNAVAHSRQEFLSRDDNGHCERRVLRTINGRFVEDASGCPAAATPPPPQPSR